MSLTKTISSVQGVGLSLTRFVNGIGVFFLAVMMVITAVDVCSRFVFNLPVTGSIEITGFALLLTVLFAIPYAAARKQHITVDVIVFRLPERARLVIDSITVLITIALFCVVVWRSIVYSMLMHTLHRITAVLQLPLSPFVMVVAFGFGLSCFVLFVSLLESFHQGVSNRKQVIIWILVGAGIVFSLYASAVWLRQLPWQVSPLGAGIIGLIILFVAFLFRLPVYASLILAGFVGMCYLRGTSAGLSIMGSSPFATASHYTFSVIPLFVLMGEFCFYSGLGRDLYEMGYKWVGQLPGGLSMGTIAACGGFAAVCGDSMATAVTMGTVALPEMKRYQYDSRLAVGCVAAGGTLGVLIPPSLAFILYALLTDQSIATLFIAGILPGILLVFLFMASIYIRARRDPSLAPPGPSTTMREKIASLRGVWATLALFALVIGGMYGGVFTPTEGGGIGASGALVIGLARRRLNWKGILSSLLEAGKISGVCISILVGAQIFGYFLAASKLPMELADFVTRIAVPNIMILVIILVIYLLLGCLMPAIPMLILTVPIFYPVITAMGYDPIWFGVIMVLMFEMAVITPPMGINVLALQAVTEEVNVGVMFRGIFPFLGVMMLCVAILILFPEITLILPRLFG